MAKTTTILLECSSLNIVREFEISHAERLLRMQNNGGWRLPENSHFKFDIENGITVNRNKKENRGKQEEA